MRPHFILILSSCCTLGMLTACGNNATSNNTPTQDEAPDTNTPDTTRDIKQDTPDVEPDTSCTPTTCETLGDVCGAQPDGCGEQLECAPCTCVDMVPNEPSCGTCGLGGSFCTASDELICDLPQIPNLGQMTDCTTLLYVSNTQGSTEGTGTQDAPFPTITQALDVARASSAPPTAILVQGNTPYNEPTLEVVSGTSIVGGFGPQWRYNPSLRAVVTIAPQDGKDVFGLKAVNIDRPTLVTNIALTNPDATEGHHNYGAYLKGAPNLSIFESSIEAGRGGDGTSGADGALGEKGNDGGDGQYGCATTNVFDPLNPFTPPSSNFPGATWNNRPYCIFINNGAAAKCGAHKGGAGGRGAYPDGRTVRGPNFQGPFWRIVLAGDGRAGSPSMTGADKGQNAQNALPITSPATSGMGGTPEGEVSSQNLWAHSQSGWGLLGQVGIAGLSAGGGGGGGVGMGNTAPPNSGILVIPPTSGVPSADPMPIHYPNGGGGGGGGCGGQPGEGGSPGGSSFGLLLVDSEGTSLSAISFSTRGGGSGGEGGAGGKGGEGGAGGEGINAVVLDFECEPSMNPNGTFNANPQCTISQTSTTPLPGGDGGNGAQGQTGGEGGGGAGGMTFGAYCLRSRPTILSDVQFTAGDAGLGGRANRPIAVAGQNGTSTQQFRCLNN